VYLCAYWYMPRDLATRISYFYCASALSGALSGLLAAAIARMVRSLCASIVTNILTMSVKDGIGGYEGWRWIFLLEGIVTVILGVSCFFLLVDSPALSTRWLKPDEIRFLELQRFIKDGGKFAQEQESNMLWKDLKMVLCNWRLYMQAYILLCISACSYGKCSKSISDGHD
jgi:MFS family permease